MSGQLPALRRQANTAIVPFVDEISRTVIESAERRFEIEQMQDADKIEALRHDLAIIGRMWRRTKRKTYEVERKRGLLAMTVLRLEESNRNLRKMKGQQLGNAIFDSYAREMEQMAFQLREAQALLSQNGIAIPAPEELIPLDD